MGLMTGRPAPDEYIMFRRSIRLLPALAKRGVAPIDALAVAYNATFLFYHIRKTSFVISPKQILKRYPLSEIARLCEAVLDGAEYGFNNNWRSDPP